MSAIAFTTVAKGLRLGEGPLVLPDGSILVCEVVGGALSRVTLDGQMTQVAKVGGGPNGAALGPDGRCYVCNNGGLGPQDMERLRQGLPADPGNHSAGSIQAVDLSTGKVETLYEHCEGVRLAAPNDLVFDAAGGFYFTDYGDLLNPAPVAGAIYYARPDGSSVRLVVPDLERPNGVGLSPAGDILFVAETHAGRLRRFPVRGPGQVDAAAGAILFADPSFGMDSLAVQADGRVCVACPPAEQIARIDLAGHCQRIPIPPGYPSNICFAGPDHRTAYVTTIISGELLRADWDAAGLPLAFEKA
jgi:gluconolactonase